MATQLNGCSKRRNFEDGLMEKALFCGAQEKVSYDVTNEHRVSVKGLIATVGSGKTIIA